MGPKLYSGERPLSVKADLIFQVVKEIIESGQEAAFLELCRERGFAVQMDAGTVNGLKTYLFRNEATSMLPASKRAQDSDQCTT